MNFSISRLFTIIVLIGSLSWTAARAQDEETSKSQRLVKVMYYRASPSAPENAYVYQVDQEPQAVTLDRHNFSDSIVIAPSTTELFFLPGKLPEGAVPPSGAPSVRIPEKWNKVLILVSEDRSNEIMPIQMMPIDASDGAFGPGEVCFMNFSEVTVFGMIGSKKLISKPQSKEVISKPRADRGPYMAVLDSYKGSPENRRRLVKQRCQYDPAQRVLTLVLPLPPPRNVTLYSAPISDF